MWVEGLFSLDIPWLFDGALNMAHPGTGKAKINTLVVSGGTGVMIGDAVNIAALEKIKKPLKVVAPGKPIPWSFRSEEETTLEFVASEHVDVNGRKVAVKHYSSNNRNASLDVWTTNFWTHHQALYRRNSKFVLASFKQYRKIIPELPVEQNASSIDTSKQPVSR